LPQGYEDSINYKTYLGDLYTATINDNRCVLPPEPYFKKDHRGVIKDRGTYEAEIDTDGGHGDTFDSGKLSHYALVDTGAALPPQVFDGKRSQSIDARHNRSLPG
jgi:hypothetical protein